MLNLRSTWDYTSVASEITHVGGWNWVFHVAVDGLFKDAIVGAPKDALKDLRKNAKQVTMKFECEKNIVNILDFNLLLIMFETLSTIQANKKGALCQTGGSQSCSVVQVEWWK